MLQRNRSGEMKSQSCRRSARRLPYQSREYALPPVYLAGMAKGTRDVGGRRRARPRNNATRRGRLDGSPRRPPPQESEPPMSVIDDGLLRQRKTQIARAMQGLLLECRSQGREQLRPGEAARFNAMQDDMAEIDS